VDSQTSACWCGLRLRRTVRLSILLIAAVAVIAAVCAAAIPATSGAASAARSKSPKHRLCSAFFSTTDISQITGVGTKLTIKAASTNGPTHGISYWRVTPSGVPEKGNLPGSLCQWEDMNPPWGSDYGLQTTARVAVGYGESSKNWQKYRAKYKAAGGLDETFPARYSKLSLGHGSSAFLERVDLWAYYQIIPATDEAGFPHYLYAVFVFTKHHNVLEAWFVTATLAKTEARIKAILTSF
jgi:hypothetical protein